MRHWLYPSHRVACKRLYNNDPPRIMRPSLPPQKHRKRDICDHSALADEKRTTYCSARTAHSHVKPRRAPHASTEAEFAQLLLMHAAERRDERAHAHNPPKYQCILHKER